MQRGQALVETIVIGAAMLPLLIGVAVIGKLLDMRQATIAASRHVAFECVADPVACNDADRRARLSEQARRRLFLRDQRGPVATDAAAGSLPGERLRVGWVDLAGRPMAGGPAAIDVDLTSQRLDAPRSHLDGSRASIARNGVQLLDRMAGPAKFGLETWGGLQVAQVQLRADASALQPAAGALPGLRDLRLRARTAVLTDAWTASGPEGGADSVRQRVDQGWRIDALEPVWDAGYLGARGLMMTAHALGLEPAAGRYRHHRVDMDVVPADRRPQP